MPQLVLASASRDRKACFSRIDVPIIIIPSKIDEYKHMAASPEITVKKLAQLKAQYVLDLWNQQYLSSQGHAVIIAADTMVFFQNEMIGKPSSRKHATQILTTLSGKTHQIYTGVCVLASNSSQVISFVDVAQIHFQELSPQDIDSYLSETEEYQGRAGAYSLFDRASLFIDHVDGSPTNVIGLPMAKLRLELRKFGINLLCPSSFISSN